jgi:polyisoprenyl-phosphate glycosyltransferase
MRQLEQPAGAAQPPVNFAGRTSGVIDPESSAREQLPELALPTAGANARTQTLRGSVGGMLSIVVPTYNEQHNVRTVYARVRAAIEGVPGLEWELIFSVDPCTDRTEQIITQLCDEDPRVKMLRFSRRFGQPMATIAGLEAAGGDAVVVIDCDLQDPPELIPKLVERWREGYDVVYAQRRTRAGETFPKRIVAAAGYRLIKRIADVEIPPNTGDFRLMSRRVVDNVVSLKEGHGFLRGLVGLVGFRQTSVPYDRDQRAAGKSKYNRFLGSLVIGVNGIVGFSRYPLHVISVIGVALSGLAFTVALVYLGLKLGSVQFPVGNPTIVIVISFFSGIQLLSLGVIGEYVGRIYDESRDRPKYIVESRRGWDKSA